MFCCGDVAEGFSSVEPMGWIMNRNGGLLAINDCFVEWSWSGWKFFGGLFVPTSVVIVCDGFSVQC